MQVCCVHHLFSQKSRRTKDLCYSGTFKFKCYTATQQIFFTLHPFVRNPHLEGWSSLPFADHAKMCPAGVCLHIHR
ncbi:hypothetical protein BRADI_5g10815v3 [Brachypodium distachyon]|uniref:Uncharacterized protein n=1 Tax=Brachypodium distachyon TaxID=15368 RepID=A0A2K2CGJ0_BRADI|nr:hypothetical protein BRADI_5g10815v3 [Brachypodium distachyon]